MIQWIQQLPVLASALGLLFIPGALLAWALRFRGFTFVAASIAGSFAIIAGASIIAPFFSIEWGVPVVIAVALMLTLILGSFRKFIPAPEGPIGTNRVSMLTTGGAVLLAAVLIGGETARNIGSPENISQSFDAVFHLNAVAEILSTGNSSPFSMNLAMDSQGATFYPTLWHAVVALIVQISGASVPVATNALGIMVAAVVWPVGILFFARPLFASRPAHLILGAVLASVFSAFPYLLLTWGVLYPNLLSTALVPFALAFLHFALRPKTVGLGMPAPSVWIAAFGTIGAATLAHPNALFSIAIFISPLLVVIANDVRKSSEGRPAKLVKWSLIAAALVAFMVMWIFLTTSEARSYDGSPLQGLGSAITNAPLVDGRAWFLTVLVITGILIFSIRQRHRWLIGAYALTVVLYTLAIGLSGPLRDFITGPWYSDAARIAALTPIAAVPLASASAALLLDLVTDGLKRADGSLDRPRTHRFLPCVGALVIFALVLFGARGAHISAQSGWMAHLYLVDDGPSLLSQDEISLLKRVENHVPESSMIAGDPWTGTALAFAYSGRPVLFPHLQGRFTDDAMELAAHFGDMDADEACSLLEVLGVSYMLDFGGPLYDIGNPVLGSAFEGLRDISSSDILELVDEEGEASLYRVSC